MRMTKPQENYLMDLISRTHSLQIKDFHALSEIDVRTAGAMIDCLKTGGDPVDGFEEFFAWKE